MMIRVDRLFFLFSAFLCGLLLTVCFPAPLSAQAVAVAQISGQITDPTGAGIPGAAVKATEVTRGVPHETISDSSGRYTLPNLPVGPYRLEVTVTGFKTYSQSGLQLQVGDNVQINPALQVGAVSENVEVSASVSQVQTEQNSVSQVIDEKRITELPLNGRQATQLILLSGASAPVRDTGDLTGSKSYQSSVAISVAGGQGSNTNYLLDGGDHNDTFSSVNLPFPFPDALQEFSVETSSLPARYGQHPGATVNVVTKSGSNALHGNLFEFLRNGNLNARNYFAASHDTLKRNQFGGTLGGKIIRDKLFFFGGYQGTRNRQNPPQTINFVPTAAAVSGDFSTLDSAGCVSTGVARTLVDPVTRQPFAGNQIPASRFSAPALALLKYLPQSSSPCGQVTFGIPTTGDEDQAIGKIDWVLSSRHTMFGRYFLADYRNPAVFSASNILVTQRAGNLQRAQSLTLGDTFTLGPTTVNAFHATFSRRRNNRGPADEGINPGTIGVNMYNEVPNFLLVMVSNAFTVGCGTCSPGHFNVNTYQVADDIDIIRGKHQIAFGANFVRSQNNILSGYLENGSFTFNGQFSGDPLADFLLGVPSAFSASRPQQIAMRGNMLGLYAQDSFHARQNLVINAGVRWEPMIFPNDYFHRGTTFNYAAFQANQHSGVFPNAPAGFFYYGDPDVPGSFVHNKWNIFQPRLGMVWDPRGNGKQSIRVGGALLYDTTGLYYSQRVATNPPYVNQIDIASPAGGFANPWGGFPGGNPFPGQSNPTAATTFPPFAAFVNIPQDLKPTYMTQWNVSYQRQLPGDWLASVTYLGNRTRHMWLTYDLNPAVYGPGATTGNTNTRRVLYLQNPSQGQYIANLFQTDDGANADYNGLLLSVQHRFRRNFTVLANYTWSHCIDDGDFTGDIRGAVYQIPNNRRADRADCGFDVRHLLNVSMVAQSPIHGNGLVGHVLGGWQIAPIVRAYTGIPLNIVSGRDNSLTGEGLDRPNLVSTSIYNDDISPALRWLNPAAFAQNPAGTFGNLGRNVARAPGQLNFDLAFSRIFSVTERWRLEARAEAFNVINHTNFNAPNGTLTSTTFGRITSAGDPRILQFAMKLLF